MRLICGCPENFREPTATFPEILMGFLSDISYEMNVRTKVEARSFIPVPEIIWGTIKKLGSRWIRPRSLFSNILMRFCSDGH